LYADANFAELYGLDPEEAGAGLPAEVFFQAIHPADRSRIKIAVAGILAGTELFSKEYRVVAPGGAHVWIHAHGRGHHDDNDDPVRFSGVFVDVTDRKRAEERLRIAQTAGGVGTFEYIDGYATATVSEEFCRLLGLHPAPSLPVQTINGVIQPGQSQLIPVARGAIAPDSLEGIFRIARKDDGGERWIARRGEILREGSGYRLVGVIYDVTVAKEQEAALRELNDTLESRVQQELDIRLQAEEALRQAQKMEAVGQLTGGVAHDFNNLLMAISSSLELLQKRVPDDPQSRRLIANALQGAQRGAALTQRMLAFARRQDLNAQSVDIAPLVLGIRDLLERTIGPAWTLELDLPDGLPQVMADANQLEMAILNLTVNARDAMTGGGAIRLAANAEYVDAGTGVDLTEGRYLKLSVIDSGDGMDAKTLRRATEPFFTTKGVGKGTGLGLSMIDGLARQLGGAFTLASTPGVGTVADLWLPASDAPSTAADPGHGPEPMASSPGRLRILAVDDDPLILGSTVDLLEDLGHEVYVAYSGEGALQILEDNPRIDLLMTDQAMPNMTGIQLAEQAITLRPGILVILASGYAEIPEGNKTRYLRLIKPYSQNELAAALDQAMIAETGRRSPPQKG
jgi:PAS domain S-box-containing protein